MEWRWRHRQEVTGVAIEEESGRREGDAQRRRERDVSAKLGGGNMSASGLPSESLRRGGPKCPYFPYCEAQHGALQCVRLALMMKEHREAMDIARKVCLHCREQEVDADGACGQCRSPRALG